MYRLIAMDSVIFKCPSNRYGKLGKAKPISFLSLLNQLSRSAYILFFQFALVQVRSRRGTCPSPRIPQQPSTISESIRYQQKLDYLCQFPLYQQQMRELDRTESWSKPPNEATLEPEQQPKAKQESGNEQQLHQQPITQQIEDDLTSLRKKENKTPLVFSCAVGGSYLVSFNRSQICSFVGRFAGFAGFIIGAQIFVQLMAKVPQDLKTTLICLCSIQIFSFLLLFFLDPGTLCQDQVQSINQQRLYCQTCRLYKTHKSRHCKYCMKCVKGYDHHCGFFGKCIGRRNYLLFCLFMLASGLNGAGSMGSLLYTAYMHLFPPKA